MEEQRKNFAKILPTFLRKQLTDARLTIAGVPPVLQEVTFYYAEQQGRRADVTRPGHCVELTCQALDALCQQRLEAVARNTGGVKVTAREFVAILSVRTRYLAAPLEGRKVKSLADALQCMENADYLAPFWPEDLPSEVRAEVEDTIPRLTSLGAKKPTGTAEKRFREGLAILTDAIWEAYRALVPTILSIPEPPPPEAPSPSPDYWLKLFTRRIEESREAISVTRLPAPSAKEAPATEPEEELAPREPSIPQPDEGPAPGEPAAPKPEKAPAPEEPAALEPEKAPVPEKPGTPGPEETTVPEEASAQVEPSVQDPGAETAARLRRQFPFPDVGHLVPRAGLLDTVKQQLLAGEGPDVIVLWGTAAAGKTALLQMLWHDPEVQDHFEFPLWADLGPEADESVDAGRAGGKRWEQLSLWADTLSLPAAHLPTADRLSQAIREQLQGRQVLLLLDDAWSGKTIRPFLVGGKAVLTTRNRALLEALQLDYALVEIPPLSLDEARLLVQNMLGQTLNADDPWLQRLYERTDGLPQALRAAAGRIQELGWEQAFTFLDDELARLPFLEQGEGRSRAESLRFNLALSYERLRPEQQHLFRTLGTLAPAPFPASAVHAVWQQQTVEVAELELRRLADLGLVQVDPLAEAETCFHLAGLGRDYARALLRERDELEPLDDRYLADQVSHSETLAERFQTAGKDTAQVIRDFHLALPHLHYVYLLACRRHDAARVYRLLVACHPLLFHIGWLETWQEWLTCLEPWLGQEIADTGEHRTLLVEWHLQRAELLLEQERAQEAAAILDKSGDLCRDDPAQAARRLLTLTSASLQLGHDRQAHHSLEQAQKLRPTHDDAGLRFQTYSLRARLARTSRRPRQIESGHARAIMACQLEDNHVGELAERLNLADSYRQFGWVKKAADQLAYVAGEAGLMELLALYLTSLQRLADLHLDAGQVRQGAEVLEQLKPFMSAQNLADWQARLRDTPRIYRPVHIWARPEVAQRIVVVGPPGSGKNALARRLARQLDWPYVALDRLHWPSGWQPIPLVAFRAAIRRALNCETWVVAGNHWQVRDIVWGRADLVLWLNYAPWQLVQQRFRRGAGGERDDQVSLGARLLWAMRALRIWRQEYPLDPTLNGIERLTPRVVHLDSPARAEGWLAEFVESKQRQAAMGF